MSPIGRKGIKRNKQIEKNDGIGQAQVADYPKEVKILGKISRVYVEGNDLYQKLVFEEIEPSLIDSKTEGKQYVIVPIKDQNSVVQFMKVPIFKLRKKPKAKNIEVVTCEKINPSGVEPLTEDLDKWSTDKTEIFPMEKIMACGTNTREVHHVRQAQTAQTAPPATPQTPPPATPQTAPPATPPAPPAPPATVQSVQEEENEPFRLLQHLVTVKEKKKKGKGRRTSKKRSSQV